MTLVFYRRRAFEKDGRVGAMLWRAFYRVLTFVDSFRVTDGQSDGVLLRRKKKKDGPAL